MSNLTMVAATDLARAQGAAQGAEGALSRAESRLRGQPGEEMRQAAQEFEAVFLAQMLRPMFDTLETSETFGGGSGEEQYRQLLVDEYGKAMARAGGIGLADQVMAEMLKFQEAEQQ